MISHVVTGGCSFSCLHGRWPYFLKVKFPNKVFKNTGRASAGNDFIMQAIIFNCNQLISSGVPPQNILVLVMWSGFDRKSFWINSNETEIFSKLITPEEIPLNPFTEADSEVFSCYNNKNGYIIGNTSSWFGNPQVEKFREYYYLNYFNNESRLIENYNYIQCLQWYCKSTDINVLNMTFADIMHYPSFPYLSEVIWNNRKLTKDQYTSAKFLDSLVDYDNWWFFNETGGLYDLCKSLSLPFTEDQLHPDIPAHEYFVENYLFPLLMEKFDFE